MGISAWNKKMVWGHFISDIIDSDVLKILLWTREVFSAYVLVWKTKTFSYTWVDQVFEVPEDCEMTIECWGAWSNNASWWYAKWVIPVTKWQKLSFMIWWNWGRTNDWTTYWFGWSTTYWGRWGWWLSWVFTWDTAIGANDASRVLVIAWWAWWGRTWGWAWGWETWQNWNGGSYWYPWAWGTQTWRWNWGNTRSEQFRWGGWSWTYWFGWGGWWRWWNGSWWDGSWDDDAQAGWGSGYVLSSATDRVLTQWGWSAAGQDWSVKITYLVKEKPIPQKPYEVNENTLAYFPFKEDILDKSSHYTLTANNSTILSGTRKILQNNAEGSYLKLNTPISTDPISVNFWYFFPWWTQSWNWKTFMAKEWWTYHHLLTPAWDSWKTVWEIWFYNSGWYGSWYVMTPWKWYNLWFTKNWTNQKIYVNGVKVMDSNSSFSNASNPIWLIANYATNQNQWPMKYYSDFIIEQWEWSDDDFDLRYRQSYLTYTSIKEKWSIFVPSVNTIAYYPFTSADTMLQDASWNWHNLTNNWATFQTVDWVPCVYGNGSANMYWSDNLWTWDEFFTVSTWFKKIDNANSAQCIWWSWANSNNASVWLWLNQSWYLMIWKWSADVNTWYAVWSWWMNVVMVYNKSTLKVYVNNALIYNASFNYTITWKPPRFLSNAWDIDKWHWYIWETIFEEWCWTDEDVSRYFNSKKGFYHCTPYIFYPFLENANDTSWNGWDLTNVNNNVTFSSEWAAFNWSNTVLNRSNSVLWTWDKQFTVAWSFKTNVINNARWEFFSFMRDVTNYRGPLLSLRNQTIQLDYNWLNWWTYPNFAVEANIWYRAVFVHRTSTDNDLYINGIKIWTVTMSSWMNLYWNRMDIWDEWNGTPWSSFFNWKIRNMKIQVWMWSQEDINNDLKEFSCSNLDIPLYTPTANTQVYFPLCNDFNDYSWNERHWTITWAISIRPDWVRSVWYTNKLSFTCPRTRTRTISFFTKWEASETNKWGVFALMWGENNYAVWYHWCFRSSDWYYDLTTKDGNDNKSSVSPNNRRHHFCALFENNTQKLYLDWNLIINWTYSQADWNDSCVLFSKYWVEWMTNTMREFISEDRIWTEQEILAYLSTYRWYFWI